MGLYEKAEKGKQRCPGDKENQGHNTTHYQTELQQGASREEHEWQKAEGTDKEKSLLRVVADSTILAALSR